jgi:uncharacterized membrane protein
LVVILLYTFATPAGLFAKADIVAYAICHRIPSHSLALEGRPLPLCARCTGTFLGAALALGALFSFRRRASDLPPVPILLVLLSFTGLLALDGLNSYLTLFPGGQPLYPPHNALRLLTGTLHGLMLGTILYPVAAGTLLRDHLPEPAIENWSQLARLTVFTLGVAALALTGWPVALWVAAVLSTLGILLVLATVYAVMFAIATGQMNRVVRRRDAIAPLLAGLALGLLMLGTIAAARYGLTGTLTGFPGLTD